MEDPPSRFGSGGKGMVFFYQTCFIFIAKQTFSGHCMAITHSAPPGMRSHQPHITEEGKTFPFRLKLTSNKVNINGAWCLFLLRVAHAISLNTMSALTHWALNFDLMDKLLFNFLPQYGNKAHSIFLYLLLFRKTCSLGQANPFNNFRYGITES